MYICLIKYPFMSIDFDSLLEGINKKDMRAWEELYAAMKRSTNGGGENSPVLKGEDDLYELFFAQLPG